MAVTHDRRSQEPVTGIATGAGRAGCGRGRHGRLESFSTWPRGGVKTVGTLPQGVPVPALPWTKWSDVGPLLVGAVGIILVSLADTVATAANFASRGGDEVDPDQEMVGIGTSNIAAGFFQGFAVSVSGSRAAVVDQSGARTQLTGLVGAGLVAVLLLVLNGLLGDLPQTAGLLSSSLRLCRSSTWVSSGDTPRSAPQRSQ